MKTYLKFEYDELCIGSIMIIAEKIIQHDNYLIIICLIYNIFNLILNGSDKQLQLHKRLESPTSTNAKYNNSQEDAIV